MTSHNKEFYEFIERFFDKDPNSLRLSIKKDSYDFDVEEAIMQIECRKKHLSKLRNILSDKKFIFPDSISGEQSTHQAVANYHAGLMPSGSNVLDMTAGLGIDAISFAKKGCVVTAIELNSHKADILKENAETLSLKYFNVINDDSIKWLEKFMVEKLTSSTEKKDHLHNDTENNHREKTYTPDLIFIDPSRRDSSNKRVYNLRDCLPDVITYQTLMKKFAEKIFIKASPLLDLTQTIRDLDNIKSVRAIGVKGECKELLIEIERNYTGETAIEAIDLDNEGKVLSEFSSVPTFEKQAKINYAQVEDLKPNVYILEPSAMMMKLAPWKAICDKFDAKKMDKSSHLFISSKKPDDFPGRVTYFQKFIKKQDRKSLSGFPASVVSKNHPLSSLDLRKSLRLKEGDENFIYATRIGNEPVIFMTTLKPITC